MLREGGRVTLVHHFVAGHPPAGQEIDHRNGNRRDNRRANLRCVTHQRNIWAQHSVRAASGWRGVPRKAGAARCEIRLEWCQRQFYAGCYANPLAAALARDDLARRVTGLDEGLNFPESLAEAEVPVRLRCEPEGTMTVWFVKKATGTLRTLRCQAVPRMLVPRRRRNLVLVLDVERGQYRTIPVRNVLCLTSNGTNYRVVRPRPGTRGPISSAT